MHGSGVLQKIEGGKYVGEFWNGSKHGVGTEVSRCHILILLQQHTHPEDHTTIHAITSMYISLTCLSPHSSLSSPAPMSCFLCYMLHPCQEFGNTTNVKYICPMGVRHKGEGYCVYTGHYKVGYFHGTFTPSSVATTRVCVKAEWQLVRLSLILDGVWHTDISFEYQ